MDKQILNGFKFGLGFLIVLITFLGIVFAVGFHSANEVLSGVFQGNYVFNGTVNFTNSNVIGIPNGNGTIYSDSGVGGINSSTVLIIQSDTTDNSVTFIDSSSTPHTITANGNTIHSTNEKKIGATSMYFDGTGDYLSVPSSADWNFGSGDMAVDFWMKPVQNYGTSQFPFDFGYVSGGNRHVNAFYIPTDQSGVWQTSSDGSTSQYLNFPTGTFTEDRWYHLAFVVANGNRSIYLDGGLVNTTTVVGQGTPAGQSLSIGARYHHSSGYGTSPYEGYIDEFRVSKGTGRWSGNFTPQTLPYDDGSTKVYFNNGTDIFILS